MNADDEAVTTAATARSSGSPDPAASRNAWRRFYSGLPPSLQLIGLQLWLPVIFIVLFCLCYIAAFHAPQVHDMPVGVVGSATNPTLGDEIGTASRGAVEVHRYDTADQARAAVLAGDVVGAVVGDGPGAPPTLYTASAHQFQARSVVAATVTPIMTAANQRLEVVDLAPLPAHDAFGMTPMYLMLAWCIGGYMVAMFIGMMGAPLAHRTRVAIILGGAVVLALVANVLAGPVIGAVQGHFWELAGIAFGWIVAIGLTVNGLSYFFGRFVTLPAILLFVFLSMPSSGAAYPTWMLPPIFGALQPFVVGFGMTEMIKRTLYGVGEPYTTALLQMLAYAVVGIVLMAVGKPWRERREVRRILAHRTTMMADAQGAAREHGIATRTAVLARYGADESTVSAEAMEDEDEQAGDVFTNYGRSLTGLDDGDPSYPHTGGRHRLPD